MLTNFEPSMDEIIERSCYYYNMRLPDIHNLIRHLMCPYDSCRGDIRNSMGSTAKNTTREALTKPEAILFLLALLQPEYEAYKALPYDQLPLHVNDTFLFPDIEALFKSRLKNG